jgi:hypothetical protein
MVEKVLDLLNPPGCSIIRLSVHCCILSVMSRSVASALLLLCCFAGELQDLACDIVQAQEPRLSVDTLVQTRSGPTKKLALKPSPCAQSLPTELARYVCMTAAPCVSHVILSHVLYHKQLRITILIASSAT